MRSVGLYLHRNPKGIYTIYKLLRRRMNKEIKKIRTKSS